ncbi:hypothetical protein HNO88_002526 [Novosphingobium chloroacetimidivorans]|uniref:Uncharacterized protein n=1 Tax=Novosphingobium chloroacetimidivorans TaxID=1428314 RepID=A0A7W7KAF9_9SPHN|nr:hypothetical protein [Novosphingobium chloroacetimidivorans]MBB4859197.1 hypothetical protein [Novosphingobium chloroacetimidivorans]
MNVPIDIAYIDHMATIMRTDEQRRAGAAARKVGGYSELIRLETERRAAKGAGRVVKDGVSWRYSFAPTSSSAKK